MITALTYKKLGNFLLSLQQVKSKTNKQKQKEKNLKTDDFSLTHQRPGANCYPKFWRGINPEIQSCNKDLLIWKQSHWIHKLEEYKNLIIANCWKLRLHYMRIWVFGGHSIGRDRYFHRLYLQEPYWVLCKDLSEISS